MMDEEHPGPAPEDDRALVMRCLERDRAAWDRLVERFSRLVHSVVGRTVRRHTRSPDDDLVDDLFGQVFLALYDHDCRRLRQWGGRCSLASWVRLVSASVTVDALRRRRDHVSWDALAGADGGGSHHLIADAMVDDSPSPLVRAAELERAALVRVALDQLSPADRELLLQLYDQELTPAEVADRLGVKPGVLYTRKNRALGRLRERVVALEAQEAWPARRAGESGEIAADASDASDQRPGVRSGTPPRPLARAPGVGGHGPVIMSQAGREEVRDERQ